jgi:hypothetical protein
MKTIPLICAVICFVVTFIMLLINIFNSNPHVINIPQIVGFSYIPFILGMIFEKIAKK